MKYLIEDKSNAMTKNTICNDESEVILEIGYDKDIKNIRVFEIAKEIKLIKQYGFRIEKDE